MSSSPDPWERREAERARFRKRQGEPLDLFDELQRSQRPLGLLFCLALLLVAEVPSLSPTLRLVLSGVGTVLLMICLALCGSFAEPASLFFRRVPNILYAFSLLASVVSFVMAKDRGLAVGELIRLVAGASAYLFTAYALRDRRELGVFLGGLLALGSGIALYDISHFAQTTRFSSHLSANKISVLGTHESIGSLLALLLPLALALSLSTVLEEKRRLATQAASLVLAFAWVVVRCRSAWLGGAAAIFLLIVLLLRFPSEQKGSRGRRQGRLQGLIGSPAFLIAGALIVMGLVGGVGPLLSARLAAVTNLLEDGSVEGRFEMWAGALRMLVERPVLGWGLGSYLLLQGRWTHMGDSPEQVLLFGTGHQNIAHNYYVQWAADTGLLGLVVFLGLLLALFQTGFSTLKSLRGSWERTLLMAALCATVGGVVEVVGSPAFQFCGLWAVFWAIAGLIIAAARQGEAVSAGTAGQQVVRVLSIAVVVGIVFLWLGRWVAEPKSEPRGVFQLLERSRGPYYPGDTIRWRAFYRDGKGKEKGTFPGTDWVAPLWFVQGSSEAPREVKSQSLTLEKAPFSDSDLLHGHSELAVRLPPGETGTVQVQALYFDRYGRRYTATRVAEVRLR